MLTYRSRGFKSALPILLVLMFLLTGCFQEGNTKSSAVHWIEDVSGNMTLDQVLTKELSTEWSQTPNPNFNLGFTDSAVWLSLPFENNQEFQASMLMEIAFPLHDSVDVYLLNDKEVVKTFRTGDLRPFSERPINHRNFLFPHILGPNEKLRAIVRLQTTDTMYMPVKVWEGNEFLA